MIDIRRPRVLFLALCAAALIAIALYIAVAPPHAGSSGRAAHRGGAGGDAAIATTAIATIEIASIPDGPVLLFRHAGPGAAFGHLALLPLQLPSLSPAPSPSPAQRPLPASPAIRDAETRRISPLSCERLHYAAGQGVCMIADESRLPVRYEAFLFDRALTRRQTIPLTGPPIRARVSPDGRRAALTVFESGHSYADAAFSTKTLIVDTATGQVLADLEAFAVRKDGAPFRRIDFNFWGVTFARDGDTFYATLKTGGARYLVKGSVDARTAIVLRDGVECPSLSPDERLIVFKKPMAREVGWRLFVLDLATGRERPLDQWPRSVDDQVDWFDARHIVYYDATPDGAGVWMLSVEDDGTPPRLLLPAAMSPAVAP